MMNDRRPIVHLAIGAALLAALTACGSDAGKQAAASSSATGSATAVLVSQPDYCKRVCERAASCGAGAALAIKNLDAEEKAAVEKNQSATTAACIQDCVAEPASDVRLQLAERCNAEQDCAAFSKCLSELGNEFRK